jgi:hypothetical protein
MYIKHRSSVRGMFFFLPGFARFHMGPGQPSTNKQVGLKHETKHGGLARYGPFTYKPVKPASLH